MEEFATPFKVNAKTLFSLALEPTAPKHVAMVKKTKGALVALIISNRDKAHINLSIGDPFFIHHKREDGTIEIYEMKVAQNAQFPLLILQTLGLVGGDDRGAAPEESADQGDAGEPQPQIEEERGDSIAQRIIYDSSSPRDEIAEEEFSTQKIFVDSNASAAERSSDQGDATEEFGDLERLSELSQGDLDLDDLDTEEMRSVGSDLRAEPVAEELDQVFKKAPEIDDSALSEELDSDIDQAVSDFSARAKADARAGADDALDDEKSSESQDDEGEERLLLDSDRDEPEDESGMGAWDVKFGSAYSERADRADRLDSDDDDSESSIASEADSELIVPFPARLFGVGSDEFDPAALGIGPTVGDALKHLDRRLRSIEQLISFSGSTETTRSTGGHNVVCVKITPWMIVLAAFDLSEEFSEGDGVHIVVDYQWRERLFFRASGVVDAVEVDGRSTFLTITFDALPIEASQSIDKYLAGRLDWLDKLKSKL